MERIVDESDLQACLGRVTYVLDARSPAEYAEDHLPGAHNVAVLDDAQRAEVGTLYATRPFEARMLGATYATAAIHAFLQGDLARSFHKSTSFLVYCARGGQRSGSLAAVLSAIGFMVYRLRKGYKSYRTHVNARLTVPLPEPVHVLYGYTGSGKTRILQALAGDCNVLDLEGLALHRGSLLGDLPARPQPSQRAFETGICEAVQRFKPGLPTLIEGESRKIGRLFVPDPIWSQMQAADHLWLDLPREQRVKFILEDYRDLQDANFLAQPLDKLRRYLSGPLIEELVQHMAESDWAPFVRKLLEHHYDPLYARPLQAGRRRPLSASDLDEAIAVVRATVLRREPC